MKINFPRSIALISLFFLLSLYPTLAQSPYKVTIKTINGLQVGQPFNTSNNINDLVDIIYQRIKPPENPRLIISIQLGSVNLKEFQNLVKSKDISAKYYEFPPNSLINKFFGDEINPELIHSTNRNYGVILSKSGYRETEVIPFKVTQIIDNNPILNFSDSEVNLYDKRRVLFILDTDNSGLDRDEIADAINSKDYRLSPSGYNNLEAYHSCIEFIRRNPQVQMGCREVNFVVILSR